MGDDFINVEELSGANFSARIGVIQIENGLAWEGRKIIGLVGPTGSGKSTLANYIREERVQFTVTRGKIDVAEYRPGMDFKISHTGISETRTFKMVLVNEAENLWICDLPGLAENRGPLQTLVNACCLRHLLCTSTAFAFAFIVSKPDIESNRGKAFKNLLHIVKQLVGSGVDLAAMSCMIVTKHAVWTFEELLEEMEDMLDEESDVDFLKALKEQNKIGVFRRPNGNVLQDDRQGILDVLKRCTFTSLETVNVDAIYSLEEGTEIQKIIKDLMSQLLSQVLEAHERSPLTKEEKRNYITLLKNQVPTDYSTALLNSDLLNMLKPLALAQFNRMMEATTRILQRKITAAVNQLELEIKEIEVIEANAEKERIEREKQREAEAARQRELDLERRRQAEQAERERIARALKAEQERAKGLEIVSTKEETRQRWGGGEISEVYSTKFNKFPHNRRTNWWHTKRLQIVDRRTVTTLRNGTRTETPWTQASATYIVLRQWMERV